MSDPPDQSSILSSFAAAQRVMAALEESGEQLSEADLPKVAGYILEGRLGAGGGGEVFRAMREGSDRAVALKILRRSLGSGTPSQRAWRELHTLEEMRLPCLPRVHDYGEANGRLFIVTDLIDGHALDEHCTSHGLNVSERVQMLAAVADAVQMLHEHGVIHRDLKPSNILITPNGQPMIIDMGLAVLMTDDVMQTLTEDGSPVGSPAFMSPEQARGSRQEVSTRSDTYSLGAIAYQLLTGGTPHDMDTSLHEAVRRVSQDLPRDARQLEPSLPKPLAAILHQAVAMDPAKRYSAAADLAADLRRWLRRERVHAQTPSVAHRLISLAVKHPAVSTALICLIIAIGIFTGTMASLWWYNAAPYAIHLDPDNRAWVRLLARSGKILHTWDSGAKNGISFARHVVQPASLGGGGVVVIGATPNARSDWIKPGAMSAFSDAEPHVPLWTTGVDAKDFSLPQGMPYSDEPSSYSVKSLMVENIFPELPGDEIVSIHFHDTWSPCLVRVTSLRGDVLFERWHRGYFHEMHWMHAPGLLVLAGHDNTHSWMDRGYEGISVRHPIVIMALQPSLDDPHQPNVVSSTTSWDSVQLQPIWRRALLPPEAANTLYSWKLDPPPGRYESTHHVIFRLHVRGETFGVWWVLNESGEVLERVIDDRYLVGGYPDASGFYLGDLPPPLHEPAE